MSPSRQRRLAIVAWLFVLASSISAPAAAQLSPSPNDRGYFRLGIGLGAAQDFAFEGFTPLPGAAAFVGLGFRPTREVLLELNLEVAGYSDVTADVREPVVGMAALQGVVRSHVDPSLQALYVMGGLGLVADTIRGEPGDFLDTLGGLGGVAGVGVEDFDAGAGLVVFYAPRVPSLFTDPRFIHSLNVGGYVIFGL